MTNQDLMSWFNDIESRYPVNQWKINGVHIWPLLRIRIAYWLRKRNMPSQSPPQKIKTKKENSVKKSYRSVVALFQFLIYYLSVSKKKYLFVGAISHREKVDRMYLNKFFDPIIDKLDQSAKYVAIWEYGRYFPDKSYRYQKYILPLKKLTTHFPNRLKISKLKNNPDILPEYEGFERELKLHQDFKDCKELANVRKQVNNINGLSAFCEILLNRIKPELVLILCYYSSDAYPIVLACKRLGIPCADFQHGPQGKVHPAYGNWHNIPKGGFNLLPNYFLTWNKSSAEAINHGFGNSEFHKGIYFGHPWIEYWKEKKEETTSNEARKKILFSLQPVGELLTKEETIMIKNTQEQYVWLMRLHPRQLHQQQALEKLIAENELKVEVKEATFKPLPSLLAQVDIHCTRSSGTTIEAAVFGIPTLLLSPSALDYYPEEIANAFAYAPDTFDSSGFITCLKKLDKKRKSDEFKMPETRNYQELLESIS